MSSAQQNDLMLVQMPSSSTSRDVWRSSITLGDDQEKISRQELQSLISRINAFQFQGKKTPSKPLTSAPRVHNPTAHTSLPEVNLPPEPPKMEKKKPTTGPIDLTDILEQTRQTFNTVTQHPESLPDPLALAELLFRANHRNEAALCYQEAFKRIIQTKAETDLNGDWMLFQIGNCLRKSDPTAAIKAYQQLMTDYPDSPWAPMARVKSKWIDWMANDDPWSLLEAL